MGKERNAASGSGEPTMRVKQLTKVFGSSPERAVELLKKGKSKDEILKQTGLTIGVNQANFEVLPGEIFVIMGLSGSGKSTLLRCLNRLIEPTSGEIWLKDQQIVGMSERKMRDIRQKYLSMVFQNFALFPHRTVLDNVAYGLEVQGISKKERTEKATHSLELVGLSEWAKQYPRQLSGGMQQRVGLARALCNDPEILLMDEAFSALDPLIREEMQDELMQLQNKMNKTIIFITHDLNEALKIGDHIALMRDGEIVQIGTPEEIISQPANEYVAKFVRGVDITKVLTAQDVMKKAEPTITVKDGPRVALRRMRESGISSIFVVGRDKKVHGLVQADHAYDAAERGEKDIQNVMETSFAKIEPGASLDELLQIAANGSMPLAVVSEDGKLNGIIVRGSILEGMSWKGENEDDE